MRTGIVNLPLHGGRAPRWLFERMTRLAREMTVVIIREYGPEEMLKRLADPHWFQSFGCVLGFDWHSSGVTTTVCGAIKAGLKDRSRELGFYTAGGKGGTSRKTPSEIAAAGGELAINPADLVTASRLSAKVDNNALQDGYQLYHHCFFFTRQGAWSVVQQGMNDANHYARRYHWLGTDMQDFVCEPHAAICCDSRQQCLNLVARESAGTRNLAAELSREPPDKLVREIKKMTTLTLPPRHQVLVKDINPLKLAKIFEKTYERQAADFRELLGMEGVGPKTIRSLSLMAELIYGTPPSYRDPARYSFAHGGKDGHPYPVDRRNYDFSIDYLRRVINAAKVEFTEKRQAFKRLVRLTE